MGFPPCPLGRIPPQSPFFGATHVPFLHCPGPKAPCHLTTYVNQGHIEPAPPPNQLGSPQYEPAVTSNRLALPTPKWVLWTQLYVYHINGYLAGASRGRITCTTTLCRVLFHEFGINPSPDDLAVALVELGFNMSPVGPELIKRTTTGGKRGIGVPRALYSSPSGPSRSGSSTPGIEKRAMTPKSPPTKTSKVAEAAKLRKQTRIEFNTGNIDPLPNKGIDDAKLRVPIVKEKKVAQSKEVMAGTRTKAMKGNRTLAVKKEKVAQDKGVVAGMRAKEVRSDRTPTTKGERVAKNKELVAGTSTKEVKAVARSSPVQNKVVSRLQGRTVTGDTRERRVYVEIESEGETTPVLPTPGKMQPVEPPVPGLVHKEGFEPAGPAAPSGLAGRVGIGSTRGGGSSGGTMPAEQRRWLLKYGSETMGLTDEMHWKARTGEFNQVFSTTHDTQMLRKIWWLLKFAQTRSAPAKPLVDEGEKFTPGMESVLVELATKNKQRDDEINWLRLRQKFNRTFKVDCDIPVLKQVYERILRKKEMGS